MPQTRSAGASANRAYGVKPLVGWTVCHPVAPEPAAHFAIGPDRRSDACVRNPHRGS